MRLFGKKEKQGVMLEVRRVEDPRLAPEVDMSALANRVAARANPDSGALTHVVLERIYLIVVAQIDKFYAALGDRSSAAVFQSLFSAAQFKEQQIWDFLTGTPTKIAMHNALAEYLASETLFEILLEAANSGAMREFSAN
jgi:hypothetical protein